MANRSVSQDVSPAGIRRHILNWFDRVRLGELARIVKQMSRIFSHERHPFVYVDGHRIGRMEATARYAASLHELAVLDAAAREQLPEGIHDAFVASFEQCCEPGAPRPRDLGSTASWRRLLECSPEQRAEVAVHAYARFRAITRCPVYLSFNWRATYVANEMFATLMRPNLPFSQVQLEKLGALMADQRKRYNTTGDAPERAILRALERKRLVEDLNPEVGIHVRSIIAHHKKLGEQNAYYEYNKDARAFRERLEALLEDRAKPFALPESPWSVHVQNEIAREPAQLQTRLYAILQQASTGRGAQPTRTWLKQSETMRHAGDNVRVARMLCTWVEKLRPSRPVGPNAPPGAEQAQAEPEAMSWLTIALHEELGRRLLWMAALLGCDAAAFKAEKFSGSRILFSGAVTALSILEIKGVPTLLNLRRKVKGAERAMVDKAIAGLAERQGVPVSTLEETTVSDYGLDANGTVELPAGAGVARISLEGSSAKLAWVNASGISKKNPPKATDDAKKQQIAAAKARAKAISDTLKGQAARLEELFLTDHVWSVNVWRKTYVDHPLLAHFARRLIWSFTSQGERQLGILEGGRLSGVDGRSLDVSADTEVRLWHPFFSVTDVVRAWRRRVNELEIVQPLKQAWREIYVLTDAEQLTDTYSNRFASHVLQQSQFRAVGRARGWNVPAQGNWDGGVAYPARIIPGADLVAEFVVGVAADGGNQLPNYSLPLITTDRVQFFDSSGDCIPLDQVPPLVLSEIFRDLDLFTSVASIGTDPAWADGGREGQFADYWRRCASGELYGSARTRRDVLADLMPMLSIADNCSLDDRHLIVRGKLQEYRIHLGSGNIIVGSNNQYLCIVPAGSGENGRVRLPFEGDGLLSVILSKAFMLAEDDKITDPQIISQLTRWF
jgi:hypothetical protein